MAARFLALGDTAFSVEFGRSVDPEINARVLVFLGLAKLNKRLELVPRINGRRDVAQV